jgi:hypothetical protein
VRPWLSIDGATKKSKHFFFHIPYFSSILNNLYSQIYTKKRIIKKLYCIRKKGDVLLCPPLRKAPPTGEAAKLTDDVTNIDYELYYVEWEKGIDFISKLVLSTNSGKKTMKKKFFHCFKFSFLYFTFLYSFFPFFHCFSC